MRCNAWCTRRWRWRRRWERCIVRWSSWGWRIGRHWFVLVSMKDVWIGCSTTRLKQILVRIPTMIYSTSQRLNINIYMYILSEYDKRATWRIFVENDTNPVIHSSYLSRGVEPLICLRQYLLKFCFFVRSWQLGPFLSRPNNRRRTSYFEMLATPLKCGIIRI